MITLQYNLHIPYLHTLYGIFFLITILFTSIITGIISLFNTIHANYLANSAIL